MSYRGVRCSHLHHRAGLCTTHSRKIHAHVFGQEYCQLWICVGTFILRLAKALSRRLKIELEIFDHFIGSRPWVSRKLSDQAR